MYDWKYDIQMWAHAGVKVFAECVEKHIVLPMGVTEAPIELSMRNESGLKQQSNTLGV